MSDVPSASENSTQPPDSASEPTTTQKLAAEFLGTLVLVLVGCGSLVLASSGAGFGDADIISVGLSFGLAVTVMIYAVGRISGGHFNPAVSVGAALSGRMPWREVPAYAGAQVGGAISGALVLLVLALGNDSFDAFSTSLAANGWGDDGTGYPLWATLLAEVIFTALFVFVILAVTDDRYEHPATAPMVIGLTLAAIHFVAIPLTGTSVNPARSIGPALFSGVDPMIQLWVFILAPLVGAGLAGWAFPALFGRASDPVEGSGWSSLKGVGDKRKQPQVVTQPGANASQPTEQPIIQNGWQWDPQAQEWIPAQQPPVQGHAVEAVEGDPSEEQTQIRPDNP